MNQLQQRIRRIVFLAPVLVFLGACGAQPPATSMSERSFEQLAPGEFESMSIDERLNVLADYCPAGTKPYCHIRSGRDECSCIEDDQMRRNLESLIR